MRMAEAQTLFGECLWRCFLANEINEICLISFPLEGQSSKLKRLWIKQLIGPWSSSHLLWQATAPTAAELKQLPLEEIKGRCPEEVEDARMYVSWLAITVHSWWKRGVQRVPRCSPKSSTDGSNSSTNKYQPCLFTQIVQSVLVAFKPLSNVTDRAGSVYKFDSYKGWHEADVHEIPWVFVGFCCLVVSVFVFWLSRVFVAMIPIGVARAGIIWDWWLRILWDSTAMNECSCHCWFGFIFAASKEWRTHPKIDMFQRFLETPGIHPKLADAKCTFGGYSWLQVCPGFAIGTCIYSLHWLFQIICRRLLPSCFMSYKVVPHTSS